MRDLRAVAEQPLVAQRVADRAARAPPRAPRRRRRSAGAAGTATSVSAPSTSSPERSGTASSAERPSAREQRERARRRPAASREHLRSSMPSTRTGSPVRITRATAPSSSTWTGWRGAQPRARRATLAGSTCATAARCEEAGRPGQVDAAPVGERRARPAAATSWSVAVEVVVVELSSRPGLDEQPLAELRARRRRHVLGDVHHHRRAARRRRAAPSPSTSSHCCSPVRGRRGA